MRSAAILPWAVPSLALALAVPLPAGCRRDGWCESVADCEAADETGLDLVWTCVEETKTCASTPCEDSSDCGMMQHCHALPAETEGVEPEHLCANGCGNDDDCMAGFFCQQGECVEQACRNGHLDCELAEVCAGGQCADAGFPFCNECQPQGNVFDYGSDEDPCDTTVVGHTFCGDGNYCWNLQEGPSCGVPCERNADCPGGFTCSQALLSGPGCPGDVIVVGKFCVSDHCFDQF